MINKLKDLRAIGSEEGFTLIELMIVVVIIGILAAIAIPIFANQQKSAIAAGVKSDVKNTVTNISTILVKSPTAAVVTGIGTYGSDSLGGKIGTTGTNPNAVPSATNGVIAFTIPVTHENTHIDVFGNWQTFYVEGSNSQIGTLENGHFYGFASDTGRYTGYGDLK